MSRFSGASLALVILLFQLSPVTKLGHLRLLACHTASRVRNCRIIRDACSLRVWEILCVAFQLSTRQGFQQQVSRSPARFVVSVVPGYQTGTLTPVTKLGHLRLLACHTASSVRNRRINIYGRTVWCRWSLQNYFWCAEQNVRQAFSAPPYILSPCQDIFSSGWLANISGHSWSCFPCQDILCTLNPTRQNIRQGQSSLLRMPNISRIWHMSDTFRDHCILLGTPVLKCTI